MTCVRFLILIAGLTLVSFAQAQLPKRDLTIELRQIEIGRDVAGGYRAGAGSTDSAWSSQSLRVRNGEKGTLRMQQSVPVQWVQSVQSQSSSLKIAGAEASSNGGGVTQALHWFDGGQSMTVIPKWPGGKKEVALEVEVQQSDMQVVHNADLPRQGRNQLTTTVTVPLNTWLTVATSGKASAPSGSYSSETGADTQRLLQIRIAAP